jgi:hypothetical protein
MNFSKLFLLSITALASTYIFGTQDVSEIKDPIQILSTVKLPPLESFALQGRKNGGYFGVLYGEAETPAEKAKLIWRVHELIQRNRQENEDLKETEKKVLIGLNKLIKHLQSEYPDNETVNNTAVVIHKAAAGLE